MLLVRAETMMAERRQVDRLKNTSGALLFSNRQRGVFSCALRDISESGVGLQLNERDVVPPTFKITLDNFRNVQTCQVIWSRGRYIGATFQR
jgi:PilZ domain